jgi:hypothetical protein
MHATIARCMNMCGSAIDRSAASGCGCFHFRAEKLLHVIAASNTRRRHCLVFALAVLPSARGVAARRHGLPEWQALPGTRFIVDRFGRAAEASGCRSWFLTHFHADHYRGLTARFKAGAGARTSSILSILVWLRELTTGHCRQPPCNAGACP